MRAQQNNVATKPGNLCFKATVYRAIRLVESGEKEGMEKKSYKHLKANPTQKIHHTLGQQEIALNK